MRTCTILQPTRFLQRDEHIGASVSLSGVAVPDATVSLAKGNPERTRTTTQQKIINPVPSQHGRLARDPPYNHRRAKFHHVRQ